MSNLRVKFKDGVQLVWDASSFEDFDKCPWFYKTRNLEGWKPKVGRVSARWGTLLHSCLEVYDHGLISGLSSLDATELAINHAFRVGKELVISDDNSRTVVTLVRAVIWYADQFRNDPYRTAILPDGKAAIEVRFEIPVPGRPYTVSGRIDRVADNDGFWIIDRKTTKQTINEHWFASFNPSIQFSTYMWACHILGFNPRGVLIEACQTMVNGSRWKRRTIEINRGVLAEFEADMVLHLDQVEHYHATGYWPRRRSGCNLYNGCNMREICNALPSQRSRYLADGFEQRPYIPRGGVS